MRIKWKWKISLMQYLVIFSDDDNESNTLVMLSKQTLERVI